MGDLRQSILAVTDTGSKEVTIKTSVVYNDGSRRGVLQIRIVIYTERQHTMQMVAKVDASVEVVTEVISSEQ